MPHSIKFKADHPIEAGTCGTGGGGGCGCSSSAGTSQGAGACHDTVPVVQLNLAPLQLERRKADLGGRKFQPTET